MFCSSHNTHLISKINRYFLWTSFDTNLSMIRSVELFLFFSFLFFYQMIENFWISFEGKWKGKGQIKIKKIVEWWDDNYKKKYFFISSLYYAGTFNLVITISKHSIWFLSSFSKKKKKKWFLYFLTCNQSSLYCFIYEKYVHDK